MSPQREHTGPATIVRHCAVFGRKEKLVRWFRVYEAKPYAQYKQAVLVDFKEPRQRKAVGYRMYSDDITYLTIEVDGQVVYDSREEVPCDMAKRDETWARFKDNPPITVSRA